MQRLVMLGLLVALIGGCGGSKSAAPQREGNLTLYDEAGEPIALIYLELPDELPAVGGTFEGDCELLWSTGDFPVRGLESGRFRATVFEERTWFDLNAEWADNNVIFRGSLFGPELRGRWGHATIAGDSDSGDGVLQWGSAP